MTAATLAVVDLGSNSFRLEIGRVEGGQIYRQDTWRETLRFGAGLDEQGRITAPAIKAALECLARFRERLSGVHPSAVRAVGTNTFRVAKNAREFLRQAERALGVPIDVIGGHEEARLIYLGVAHVLPPSTAPRLVVDIGGGSTEFIIGRGLEESIAYARTQRVSHVLVVGSPRTKAGELLTLDLATGGERTLPVAEVLEHPAQYFREAAGGSSHA